MPSCAKELIEINNIKCREMEVMKRSAWSIGFRGLTYGDAGMN